MGKKKDFVVGDVVQFWNGNLLLEGTVICVMPPFMNGEHVMRKAGFRNMGTGTKNSITTHTRYGIRPERLVKSVSDFVPAPKNIEGIVEIVGE